MYDLNFIHKIKRDFFTLLEQGPIIGSIIIFLSFIILNSVLYSFLGLKVMADSPRYLMYAEEMLAKGFYIDPHNIWYVGYVLFIWFFKYLGLSLYYVILFQYIFSLIAVFSIFFSAKIWSGSWAGAWIAAMLYLLFFEISIYNSYILCESLFVSFISISLLIFSIWSLRGVSWLNLTLGIPIVLFTIFIKPTGFSILACLVLSAIMRIFNLSIPNPFKWTGSGVILICLILFLNKSLGSFSFLLEYLRGDLIFGMFLFTDKPFYDLMNVRPPVDVFVPDETLPPLIRLIQFIFFNSVFWVKLFFGKIFYLLFHIRPFWSGWHNVFSLLFLMPVYISFFKGINFFFEVSKKGSLLMISFLCIHILSVGMMIEDWDGRFLMPMLPVVFLISGHFIKEKTITSRP